MGDGNGTNRGYVATRSNCRACGRPNPPICMPLPALPVASPNVGRGALVDAVAPSDVHRCHGCGLLQLCTVVDPAFQYRAFRYTTAVSPGLRQHFQMLVDRLVATGEIRAGTFVFDIGSNDGSLLRFVRAAGARVLGIDPAVDIAAAATRSGIPTIGEFFDPAMGARIAEEHGAASVVISANTVANIDDLEEFFAGIGEVLAPDGLVVIETQYALDVLQKMLLDVIYHEHLSYFSVRPVRMLVERLGFQLVDAERIAVKGGSIRFYIQRTGGGRTVSRRVAALMAEEAAAGLYDDACYAAFLDRVGLLGAEVRRRLAASREATGRAVAFGSSVGCAALIQYLGLSGLVDALFDDRPLVNFIRQGAGTIPVLSGSQLANEAPCEVAVLAWRYADAIAARQATFRAAGGRFYRVLPEVAFTT